MSKQATILIIDDNAMNLDIAKDLLENAGYDTLDAEDALTGIQLMKIHQPDLVLLDLLMPQMDGFEAVRVMKEDPGIQNIPIIAFTALASGADRNKALEYGCQDIITKPIDPAQVIKTIQMNLAALNPEKPVVSAVKRKTKMEFLITSRPHKVLVVDDNAINVDLLKEALESMGQTVISAHTGEEALKLAQEEYPALILLDIMMPAMNGYVVLENLKANPETADIPVIIISALSRTEDRIKGLVQGATDYISKPFEYEEVKARVSAVLRNKDLRDELKRQRDDLAAINKELAEFTTIASHDLQAPLRKISMFVEHLQKSNQSQLHEEDTELLQRIQSSTIKMQALIQDLLSLSRAGYRGRDLRPVNLNTLVQEALDELNPLKVQTEAQVHIGELPVLLADEVQIKQLLVNLLSNAMKFHREEEKPVIKVTSCHLDQNTVQLIIEDNGLGFSEEQSERIFKAFERLHGVSQFSGSGIGLAICKKVAERHGGSIVVKSTPRFGSTFIVTLPLQHNKVNC